MAEIAVRVWTYLDYDSIKEHIMLIEDIYGMCGKCKQLGLNFVTDRKCKGCGTEFRYLATKLTNPADVTKIVNRIRKENLNVQLIDRSDYDRAGSRNALGDLFKS